ncbi:TonB-dependent receptor plug domain-containing protein [Sporomusa sphaeroides]|uniref:Colicin I receptor n=1 Tax=Sporomusa sphaeroides DSM 2875 TaxID=1337886 RepID=A0ABM9VZJ6_9FIRM|nr:TonB-dependent receptor [Sporomusa sphaeroides]OLS57132.1 colicin I receptor precursor [Sporomusa sphaeroides DSM 2875]CVK18318.1 Colicin I receptor precursor [Sporomusa sphaeroides DSM 2875]
MKRKAKQGNFGKNILMTMLITGTVFAGSASALAAEKDVESYTLDSIVVTAQRYATEELDTPAAVEVFTQEQLVATGGTNLQEALKFGTGLIYHAQGPRGTSQGTMTSKIVIRGVEKGTLVLIDGVPLNQSGRYNLDDIPVETVERVEIIRGGGSVLYGSEATGGVINIITKGKRTNSVRTAFGNYGMQSHAFNTQAGKLGISYSYDKTGAVDNISDPSGGRPEGMYYNIIRGEHNTANLRYDFNDAMYLSYTYGENNAHYVYRYSKQQDANGKDIDYKNAIHTTKNNNAQLHYDKDDWKAVLSYVRREQETRSKTATKKSGNYIPGVTTSDSKGYDDKSLGMDIQKKWELGKNIGLLGFNFQRDTCDYKEVDKTNMAQNRDYERNMYSFYGQYNYELNKLSNLIVSARETWTGSTTAGQNYNKFTPEIEYIHKLDDDTSAYAKAGQSFMMPTFSQIYGSGNIIGNATLEPQHGNHFEIGLKKNTNTHMWRLAVFNYKINDSIESKWKDNYTEVEYTNEDIKNTGIELTCAIDMGQGWKANWGASYSNPKKLVTINDAGTITEGSWRNYYGKLQLNGGLNYNKGKWSGAINANYLGERTRDNDAQASMKPQLFTDLNIVYKPTKNEKVYLNLENIFDRRDIVSTSTSTFYNLGRNVMVGYEFNF